MRKYFLSTSSLISVSILVATLCSANAENNYNTYSPNVEISTRASKKRNINEFDYMQPIWGNDHQLSLVDLKLKLDNKRSKEINLGLVYRYNLNDQVILGVYGYYDHRHTGNSLSVSGFTPGVELLSKYIDFRANYYLPQNKSKKVQHNSKKQVIIQGTNIFAVSGGHNYEYALRGYDVEVGAPVFGLSDNLNEKFGTKLFVARYDFRNKHTKNISGTRFRLEQPLGSVDMGNNGLYFNLNAETQFDKVRKRQNFVGISAKLDFGNKKKKPRSALQNRMMDTVIRDVDIVTEVNTAPRQVSNFTLDGREIKKIYHVGAAGSNYQGDGTKESPYSIEQLNQIDIRDAIVVVTNIDNTKGGKAITKDQYENLKTLPQVINEKGEVNLVSTAEDSTSIIVRGGEGVSIVNNDQVNTSVIVDPAFYTHSTNQNSLIIPVAPKVQLAPEPVQPQPEPQAPEPVQPQPEPQAPEPVQPQLEPQAPEPVQVQLEPQALVEEEEWGEALRNLFEEGIQQPVLAAQGTINPGVDIHTLNPFQLELYNIIMEAGGLRVADPANEYMIRQTRYDDVVRIIRDNPANGTIDEIEGIIDQTDYLDLAERTAYKRIARDYLGFNGELQPAGAGGQQGMGGLGRGARDVSGVLSLEDLRADYGTLDGRIALELGKRFVVAFIKQDLGIDNDIAARAAPIDYARVIPTHIYQEAAVALLNNLQANGLEAQEDRERRLLRKQNAKTVIDLEVRQSRTAVNNTLAAYRALNRIEYDPNGLYTDKVIGRYNAPEMLAYVLLANLDVREVQRNLILERNNDIILPQDIFIRQIDNIKGLVTSLGDSQRAYNMDPTHGIVDAGGVQLPQVYLRGNIQRQVQDDSSCAHGVCTRIIDAATTHSKVVLSDANPAGFSDEFSHAVTNGMRQLNHAELEEIEFWSNTFNDEDRRDININYTRNQIEFVSVTVGLPPLPPLPPLPIPASYHRVLQEVAHEMDARYRFTNNDPRMQMVKRPQVEAVFKEISWIPVIRNIP